MSGPEAPAKLQSIRSIDFTDLRDESANEAPGQHSKGLTVSSLDSRIHMVGGDLLTPVHQSSWGSCSLCRALSFRNPGSSDRSGALCKPGDLIHRAMEPSPASACPGTTVMLVKKNQQQCFEPLFGQFMMNLPIGLLGFSVPLVLLCNFVCLLVKKKKMETLKHVNKNLYFFLT